MLPIHFSNLLDESGIQYAAYYAPLSGRPAFKANADRFPSASMIKVPILLAWIQLEKAGQVNRAELCSLDDEPEVQGAGFSWLLRGRQIPYQDVILMMIAISDNLCTNLVIHRAGLERLNRVFQEGLGLRNTQLQRKLFDYETRARGLDNWISAQDCIRLYQCIAELDPSDRAWVDSILATNQDDLYLMREIPRDTIVFHHKTGTIIGVLHDWGYTDTCQMFLLTQNVQDEVGIYPAFGELGKLLLEK